MKILKLGLISILFLFFLISCEKQRGDSIDVTIRILVTDSQGQNLLNSPILYDKNSIRVSHIINGQTQVYTGSNSTTGFRIDKDQFGVNGLTIFPTSDFNQTSSTTLIQFGTTKVDTIKCEFDKGSNWYYCNKVWLNGTLKYSDVPRTNSVARSITIIK